MFNIRNLGKYVNLGINSHKVKFTKDKKLSLNNESKKEIKAEETQYLDLVSKSNAR